MSDDLSQRYADAVSGVIDEWATRPGDSGQFIGRLVAALMAVRDEELERLRLIAKVNDGLHRSAHEEADEWRERAEAADLEAKRLGYELEQWHAAYGEKALPATLARLSRAEVAIARVRRLAEEWAELAERGDESAASLDRAVADSGRDLLAALDDSQDTDRG